MGLEINVRNADFLVGDKAFFSKICTYITDENIQKKGKNN